MCKRALSTLTLPTAWPPVALRSSEVPQDDLTEGEIRWFATDE